MVRNQFVHFWLKSTYFFFLMRPLARTRPHFYHMHIANCDYRDKSTIPKIGGILISFLDVRQSFDYLKATFDILKDENTSLLQIIKEIDEAYEKADEMCFHSSCPETKVFNKLLEALPERAWIE